MNSYKDLILWKKSMDLVIEIYQLTDELPKKEQYGLIDQMRRAAVSIPSNIAEGFGRKSNKDFIRFINIARGSLYDLETQLELCVRLQYLTFDINSTKKLMEEISRLGASLIRSLDCK